MSSALIHRADFARDFEFVLVCHCSSARARAYDRLVCKGFGSLLFVDVRRKWRRI